MKKFKSKNILGFFFQGLFVLSILLFPMIVKGVCETELATLQNCRRKLSNCLYCEEHPGFMGCYGNECDGVNTVNGCGDEEYLYNLCMQQNQGGGRGNGNTSGGSVGGGNTSGGNGSGGSAGGGNTSGGSIGGGNTSGGNGSGGSAGGGNTSGGSVGGGNTSGGSVGGGNTSGGNGSGGSAGGGSGGSAGGGNTSGGSAGGGSGGSAGGGSGGSAGGGSGGSAGGGSGGSAGGGSGGSAGGGSGGSAGGGSGGNICSGDTIMPEGGTSASDCTGCADGTKASPDNTKCICDSSVKCCGIKLNTVVPFIGDCIELDSDSTRSDTTSVNSVTAFPILMQGLMKIVMSVIMVFSFIMLIVAGLLMTAGSISNNSFSKGKTILKNVIISLILLGCSGLILSLINPSFFGG